MLELNLPQAELNIKEENGKAYVFDRLRKQFVRLTPEEYVRQSFVSYLITYKNYPQSRMANEIGIELGNVKKRCDTVLYDEYLHPLMIIEFKAPSILIKQNAFDQITRYNMRLNVPWLIVSNGVRHYCCRVDYEKKEYFFLKDIPEYEKLKKVTH
ncbi:MAG: type I restriction enzyme HsdR N-terminal domain-containing protein [Dysgonamonadaceae bacterium]|nr:type I restriction enzyme HsdR N-terminal domain-containing protein [Dysgonamonadaceae bacterium]